MQLCWNGTREDWHALFLNFLQLWFPQAFKSSLWSISLEGLSQNTPLFCISSSSAVLLKENWKQQTAKKSIQPRTSGLWRKSRTMYVAQMKQPKSAFAFLLKVQTSCQLLNIVWWTRMIYYRDSQTGHAVCHHHQQWHYYAKKSMNSYVFVELQSCSAEGKPHLSLTWCYV